MNANVRPEHSHSTLREQQVSVEVRNEKYAVGIESIEDIRWRVARALVEKEAPEKREALARAFFDAQCRGFIPAGRINSAAGTDRVSTLMNCGVLAMADRISGYDKDGTPGIFVCNQQAAESQRRGMGIGYDFSPIRPRGALVRGTGSKASGPVSYMNLFDSMCRTVESAGSRRGAQMGVLRIDHPDIEEFVTAKQTKGMLNMFNVSVAVTDDFMATLESGQDFELTHEAEPYDKEGRYQRDDGKWVYRVIKPAVLWDLIMRQTYDHAEPGVLFVDQANRENNLWYCETLSATNPCAEEYLPPNGVCCLGSMNLTAFVIDAFTENAKFDFDVLGEVVPVAVRMLDNVLDITHWPLPEQKVESDLKRRIGLGFTGLGDTLCMLGIRYDSEEGRAFAAQVAEFQMVTAYAASVELAREKEPFPKLDVDQYLESGFCSRLPSHLRDSIREHGIRNSHLLAIAPTGTISLSFADNASNGIEPPFSWFYTRKKRVSDAETKEYAVVDHAFRRYVLEAKGLDPVDCDSATLAELASGLPDAFVSALEMTAEDHMQMVSAVQPYVDTSISKTVNLPTDYSFEDFKWLYAAAAKSGLKGLATFRPNEITGSVLSTDSSSSTISHQQDADRRLAIKSVPEPVMNSLRWPKRPELTAGNPSWTYMVKTPQYNFGIFIGHTENGFNYPFEVWVNGAEQPRGLGAIAKALSMDMRSEDRLFLKAKLDSLEKARGDDGFRLTLPSGDSTVTVPSLVSGFAKLIKHRIAELGAFPDQVEDGTPAQGDLVGSPTPMMDALMSPKEPKTRGEGTVSWSVDIKNPATGDDCVLTVKELQMPDGTHRPYSVWLAGEYPRVLDGLCKVLSIDMRIIDPAWIGAKLRSLLDFPEARGDFFAPVPGEDRQRVYSSTVAYIATLLIHRYATHGVLDGKGYPVEELGCMDADYGNVIKLTKSDSGGNQSQSDVITGKTCAECSSTNVIAKDGCSFCLDCGAIGDCG